MKRLLLVFWIAALGAAAAVRAQDQDPTVKIVLHPMSAPRPALKYQLLPPMIERQPGNAAVIYNKIPAERTQIFGDSALWDKLIQWQETQLAELRRPEVRSQIESLRYIVEDLDRAGRYESADWQLPIREHEFWSMLIPEAQQVRSYARILAPYARLQMADGQYDDAVRTLRSGYALARHVARGQTLIHGLIGGVVAELMSRQVRDLVQQPDAPNLYWALASLPRPLIDFRPGFEAEMHALYFSFPELRDLDKKQLPPGQWQKLWDDTSATVWRYSDSRMGPELAGLERTAASLQGYSRAKRFLIERGRTPAEVEAMPVPQVLLLYTLRTYDELRDDVFKWLYLPYPEAERGIARSHEELKAAIESGREIIPVAGSLLPAVSAAKSAEARFDRTVAALQVLEAIRLYAADHAGRLPDRLADITEVPVPPDPVRGEPFLYHVDGRAAVLESPVPPHARLRYQIEIARKEAKP